ncbi:MAG TPA: protein translocase subunit SecF, partial [Thermodesulfobacteriota bacterium]|nr:protein translocase subunit SecF [Thermodesulfobacteriota bacterium]
MDILGGRKPNIDFIGRRRIAFVVSACLSLLGLVAFVAIALGRANLGIEFAGGVAVQVDLARPVAVADARAALARAGLGEAEPQSVEGASRLLIRVKRSEQPLPEVADRIVAALQAAFPDNPLTVVSSSTIGPTVGRALRRDAMIAVAISLVAIVLYIAVRFQFRFGVAATIATFHDVLAVLGLFWLAGKEVNLLLVVALLTLAGYSLSDTVVVFDRIRETLARGGRRPLGEVINASINDVLSRTLVTGLTTLLASLSLFFFGGEVLRDFALALTVGILIGTYSSIFVASPILYVWGLPGVRPGLAPAPATAPAEGRAGTAPAPAPG